MEQLPFFRRPIGMRRDPFQQGELGPVYRDAAGNSFQIMPEKLPAMKPIEPEKPKPMGAMKAAALPMGNWSALARAIYEGLTAPKRAAQGKPVTYGEAFGTALDAMGGGAFSRLPDNALGANSFRAYHGSPHDFDKFSLDKIGTGEGAQAYGHGLYFAEAEDVARTYREGLSRHPAQQLLDRYGGDVDAAIAEARRNANTSWGRMNPDVLPALEGFKSGGPLPEPGGHMYEVNINADPDTFLDWDMPLAGQAPKVRDAIRSASPDAPGMLTGNALYEAIAKTRTPRETGKVRLGAADTSAKLRDAGIPGIRYRDQGSRGMDGTASATRNFVVFDDNLIEIVRKYGIAALAPLGLSAAEKAELERKAGGT